ncbi:MAG: hypothetical protein GWP08_03090 [Nitrospiraceae bacterium]|nr:hypothetical protein [Nitrospiraceae bacterium]
MRRSMKYRLSVMMFLEYFVPGATYPILSHYLKNYLHFEPRQVGVILAMPAAAALIAPFITSHVADRHIRSERLLGLCHLLAGVVMLALSQQTTFYAFLGLYFVYGLMFTPTFGLTNTVALHHVPDAKRDFGGIRMWGTVGWVVVAWVFGYFWLRGGATPTARLPHLLYISACASFSLALYSLTLPVSKVDMTKRTLAAYGKALKLFARPSMLLLCALTFFASLLHQIYYLGMSPFLSQIGFANHIIMPTMAFGQLSEVIVLGLLGVCLMRLTIKQTMIIGLLAQTVRYAIFAYGRPDALIASAIGLHGFCYAFYFTTAYLYIDQHSTLETRAGAQQLLTIVITGFGPLTGLIGGGYFAQWLTNPDTGAIDFQHFWMAPAALSLVVAVVLGLFFKEEPVTPHCSPVSHSADE